MNTGRKLLIWFFGAFAALAILSIWIMHTVQPDARLSFPQAGQLSADLREEGNARYYTAVLPDAFDTGQSLLFKSTHAQVEVLLDDSVLYTFGTERSGFGKSPGTYWHIVEIPAGSAGRSLTVHLTTVYNTFYGSQIRLQYGSRGDCIVQLVEDLWFVLILNCMILFAGVISLFLHGATRQKNRDQEPGSFLCIGLFAITIALWSLRQSGLLQFWIPSGRALYFVDMVLFFLFPVPLNLFIYTICRSRYKKGFIWLAAAYLACLTAEMALQLLGIVDMFEMLRLVHVLMACNAVYVFWEMRKEKKLEDNSTAGRFQVPLYILMVFGIAELISYYTRIFDDISIFLPTGTVVFIVMLIWQQVKEYYHTLLEEQKMLYYEKLAKTDILTGAQNRNAYEAQLKHLAEEGTDLNGQCVILFDLNNMKTINDTFGHEKGDEALKTCYRCMQKIFGGQGICYRIGGDEFAFLARDMKEPEVSVNRFNEMIRTEAQHMEYPFCVALGYAVYDPDTDADFRMTVRRSDARMYEDKKQKKAEGRGRS